ncbi:hypothetical protein IAR50_003589 [Cryptococcus sp. DSM 104548]
MALPPASHGNTRNAWYLQLKSTAANATAPREFSITKLACTDPEDIPTKDGKPTKPLGLVHGGVILGRKSSQTKEHGESGVFTSPILSRAHAQLTMSTNGHVYITDLSSLHGTSILPSGSNELVALNAYAPVQLCQDDTIVLGKEVFADGKEFAPFKLQVTFAYPELGQGSDNGTRRTLGKLTPEVCHGKFLALSQKPLIDNIISEIEKQTPVVVDSDDEDDIEVVETDKSSKYGIPAWMRYTSEAPISQARYENASNLGEEEDDIVAVPSKALIRRLGYGGRTKSQSVLHSDDENDEGDYPRNSAPLSPRADSGFDASEGEDEEDNEQDGPEVLGVREVIEDYVRFGSAQPSQVRASYRQSSDPVDDEPGQDAGPEDEPGQDPASRQSSPEYSPKIAPAAQLRCYSSSLEPLSDNPVAEDGSDHAKDDAVSLYNLDRILNQAEGHNTGDDIPQEKSLLDEIMDYQPSPALTTDAVPQATEGLNTKDVFDYDFVASAQRAAALRSAEIEAALIGRERAPRERRASAPVSVAGDDSECEDEAEPAQNPVAPHLEPEGQSAFDDAMSAGWPSEQDQLARETVDEAAAPATDGEEKASDEDGEEDDKDEEEDDEEEGGVAVEGAPAALTDQDEEEDEEMASDASSESSDSSHESDHSASESEDESESEGGSEEVEDSTSRQATDRKQLDVLEAIACNGPLGYDPRKGRGPLPDIYSGPEECLDDEQIGTYFTGLLERERKADADVDLEANYEQESDEESDERSEDEDEDVQESEAENKDKVVQQPSGAGAQDAGVIEVDAPENVEPAAVSATFASAQTTTPSTSSPASDRILTPVIGQKRPLPQEDDEDQDLVPVLQLQRLTSVQVPTETPGTSSAIEVTTAGKQNDSGAVVQPPAKRRNVAQAMGLVVLGAALGSIGTIASLMQLAEE